MVLKVTFRKNPNFNPNRVLKEGVVRVGFFEGSKYDDDTYVAQEARWNEYGIGVPARPFMRPAVFEKKQEYTELLRSEYKKAIKDNQSTINVLKAVGEKAVAGIQSQIWGGHYLPNSPATIKRKGKNKPLIDTELMVNSVSYQVEEVFVK